MSAFRRPRTVAAARPWACVVLAAALLGSCGKDDAPEVARGAAYGVDGRLLRSRRGDVVRPNLVLIVIDTLRADALGAGESGTLRMPWLEGLARRGTRFTEVAATAPWTLPSMTSLLTGLATHAHGVGGESGVPDLPPGFTTFAEVLREAYGYATAAFVGGRWGGGDGSMLAGFSHVKSDFALQGIDTLLWPWAKDRDRSRPFFLLLHTFEVHHPYGSANHPFPPPPSRLVRAGPDPIDALGPAPATRDLALLLLTNLAASESLIHRHRELYASTVLPFLWRGLRDAPDEALAAQASAAYWEGVSWVDDLLRRAAGRLREWGLLEDTLLVVTADHGEAFGEHGLLVHGRDCHDELIRVPLVVDGLAPFQGGQRVAGSMSLADVLPTFLDLNRMAPLDGISGRSALPLLGTGAAGRPVESEEWVTPAKTGGEGPLYVASLRSVRWKVILTRDPASTDVREEAYDLARDPREQDDLAGGAEGAAGLPFDEPFRAAFDALRRRVAGALVPPR
jgi:arylsulfatase A-like enzyme